jgi:hypothetical protein
MKVSEAKLDTPVLASGHLANAGAVCKVSLPTNILFEAKPQRLYTHLFSKE